MMVQDNERSELLRCVLDLGEAMLVCGGEVSRVEDTISRILHECGAERVDVFTIISCISLTAVFPDGNAETQIRRVQIKAYATDLQRLERLNALSREICSEKPAVDEMRRRLENCSPTGKERRIGNIFRAFGYVLAGGAFAVFFGGTLLDGAAAALVSLLVWLMDGWMKRADLQRLLHAFLVSVLAGAAALLLALTGVGIHAGKIMMGVIMLLIPGIAITNAMRDMLIGDTISGILRLVEALLHACAVAAGFALAILLSRGLLPDEGLDAITQLPAIQVLTAALGATGFGMLFRLQPRRILLCTLGGGLTWVIYLLCASHIASTFLCCSVAAACGACCAEAFARLSRAPVTSYLMGTEIALIPGGLLFITMQELVSGRADLAILYATRTWNTALAIALGIVFVAAFMRVCFRKNGGFAVG